MERAESIVNKTADRDVFMRRVNWVEKKNHEKIKINRLYDRDDFMERVMQMKFDLKI